MPAYTEHPFRRVRLAQRLDPVPYVRPYVAVAVHAGRLAGGGGTFVRSRGCGARLSLTGVTRGATRAFGALFAVLLVAAGWLVGPAAGGGRAEEPPPLAGSGRITDRVDALGVRAQDVARALDVLYDERRVELFVVYVRDFSGRPAQEWADATAARNGLGSGDALLAVATRDRAYAQWAEPRGRPSRAQMGEVGRVAVEPALAVDDWAGAAIGAAEGYGAVLAGEPVPEPEVTPGVPDPGGAGASATDLVLPVVLVAGACAAALYAYVKRRRRAETRTTPHGGVPVPEAAKLEARAARALIDTDDAVRTSQEELRCAAAQCGDAAVRPFAEALAYAEGELTAAFGLRQRVDEGYPEDAYPEDAITRRAMLEEVLGEITARCADADRRLDEEAEAFDELRDLRRTAADAVAAAEGVLRDLTGRVTTAEAALVAMRRTYAESAADPVASAPEQARERVEFAEARLTEAREALEGADTGGAVVRLRAAEGALDQARRLVDAVERRAVELAEAAGKLPGALTDAEADLVEARERLKEVVDGVSAVDLRARVARVESVTAGVRRHLDAERYDPVDALRRVEEADAALDEALAEEGKEEARRVRGFLEQAQLCARSAVGAAEEYVGTHRGVVGVPARTRLAEARRLLAEAGGEREQREALATVQEADGLARQAQALAEQDVRLHGAVPGDAAVLGGILLRGGGPASFGGGGTRGRLGGGGRF